MTSNPPWFVLVAGINGSGKSTFAQNPDAIKELCGLTGEVDEIEIINPDLITKTILQQEPDLPLDKANLRAAVGCENRVWNLIEAANRSLVIETVLSTDKYKEIIKRAQEKGFRFFFYYMTLESVDVALRRIAHRVVNDGGHDVAASKVRKRWPLSLKRVPWFWKRADLAYIYFNGDKAPFPIRLAEKRNGWMSVPVTAVGPSEMSAILRRLLPTNPAKRKRRPHF